jgi:hypothetical protein
MSGKPAVKASLRTLSIVTVKQPFEGQRWRWASCSLRVIRLALEGEYDGAATTVHG